MVKMSIELVLSYVHRQHSPSLLQEDACRSVQPATMVMIRQLSGSVGHPTVIVPMVLATLTRINVS